MYRFCHKLLQFKHKETLFRLLELELNQNIFIVWYNIGVSASTGNLLSPIFT